MSDPRSESVRSALVRLLRSCVDYLADLPDRDVDAFVSGDIDLRLSILRKKTPKPKKQPVQLDDSRLAELSAQLRALPSRDEGNRLLEDCAPTKSALEVIARYLDVPVRKEDRAEQLRRRIIEATIGFRLSSAAIQGEHTARAPHETGTPSTQGTSRPKR